VATYLQERSTVLSLFFLHQLSALFVALTLLGVWRMYAPGGLAPLGNSLTSYAIPFSAIVTILFHARLLTDLGARSNDVRTFAAGAALPALGILLVALGFEQIGLFITHLAIAVFMIFTIFIAVRLNRDSLPVSRWRRPLIVAAYIVMTASMAPQWMRVLGVLPAGIWSFSAYFFYGVVSAVLMTSLLILRAREVDRQRQLSELALGEAKRESELQRARALEQGDLIAMLTHELKTPLSVVALALGQSGRQPAIQERAALAVENMREVIDRCALTARVDEDVVHRSLKLKIQSVRIDQVLQEAASAQPQVARIKGTLGTTIPECMTDRTIVYAVISNLIDNAIKYSPPDSALQVHAMSSSMNGRPGVIVRVINQVVEQGRPDPSLVFEKYYRGARARHRSGSGLGLYLSKSLAQRLGGELSMSIPDESNVCFELWIPVTSTAASD
jgi:signal transduction histidine kinase